MRVSLLFADTYQVMHRDNALDWWYGKCFGWAVDMVLGLVGLLVWVLHWLDCCFQPVAGMGSKTH